MQPTRDPPAPRRTVRGDGVDLSVAQVGPADGPAAVIAHGVGSSARFVLDAFTRAVVGAGFRLVSYDLRGHGASGPARTPAEHTLDRHVADLRAVVDEVAARVVGGISLGGHAAAAYAADARGLEGLIVCLPAWTGRARPGQGPHAAVAEEIRAVGVRGALDRATSDPAVADWLRDLLRRDWEAADAASLEAALVALDGGGAPEERTLRSIAVPTGIVGWCDDPGHPIEVARAWRRWIPRASFEPVDMTAVGERPSVLGAAGWRALVQA